MACAQHTTIVTDIGCTFKIQHVVVTYDDSGSRIPRLCQSVKSFKVSIGRRSICIIPIPRMSDRRVSHVIKYGSEGINNGETLKN